MSWEVYALRSARTSATRRSTSCCRSPTRTRRCRSTTSSGCCAGRTCGERTQFGRHAGIGHHLAPTPPVVSRVTCTAQRRSSSSQCSAAYPSEPEYRPCEGPQQKQMRRPRRQPARCRWQSRATSRVVTLAARASACGCGSMPLSFTQRASSRRSVIIDGPLTAAPSVARTISVMGCRRRRLVAPGCTCLGSPRHDRRSPRHVEHRGDLGSGGRQQG